MKEQMSIAQLQNTCIDLKKHVIDMIYKAQSGHPGGSLSVAEFVTACYFREMNVDPENPKWEDRDRFVMSKGHVCPAQYAALAMRGFFPMEVLDTLRKEGSMLQGHPDMKKCPGIDISTGSLGQGLACGVGMAIAGKMNEKGYHVYVDDVTHRQRQTGNDGGKKDLAHRNLRIGPHGHQHDGGRDQDAQRAAGAHHTAG